MGRLTRAAGQKCTATRLPKIIFMTLTNQRLGCFVHLLSTAPTSDAVASSGLYPRLPQNNNITPGGQAETLSDVVSNSLKRRLPTASMRIRLESDVFRLMTLMTTDPTSSKVKLGFSESGYVKLHPYRCNHTGPYTLRFCCWKLVTVLLLFFYLLQC